MTKIAIVYYSMYGHVKRLADEIKSGAEGAGVEVDLFQVPETLPAEVLEKMKAPPRTDVPVMDHAKTGTLPDYDGVVFGFPTRFGIMAHQMKQFFDGTGGLWMQKKLIGKPAATFCSSNSQNGGQETTHLTAVTQLVHHGMIYVPLGYRTTDLFNMQEVHGGSPYGASTHAGAGDRLPTELDLKIARTQGESFAGVAKTLGANRAAATQKSAEESFSQLVHARYACKAFNPERQVPENSLHAIMELTQRCATSFNTQPWVAVVVQAAEGKRKLIDAHFDGNKAKMESAPVHVVFAGDLEASKLLTDDTPDWKRGGVEACMGMSSPEAWAMKQTSIAVQTFLFACQAHGLSTNPMEGFTDPKLVREAVGLTDRYCVPVVVSVGYEAAPREKKTTRYAAPNVWFTDSFDPKAVNNA